jgi:hypothetical protein
MQWKEKKKRKEKKVEIVKVNHNIQNNSKKKYKRGDMGKGDVN